MAIHNGNIINESIIQKEFGGIDITNHLKLNYFNNNNDLFTNHYIYNGIDYNDIIYDIKENFGYVSSDYNSTYSDNDSDYKLPDGNIIKINNNLKRICGESLFNPSLIGINNCNGIDKLINDSISLINNSDGDDDHGIKNKLYKNILLSGGSIKFNGLINRLSLELLNNNNCSNININNNNNEFSSWLGGSKISSLSSFKSIWLSKYDDY